MPLPTLPVSLDELFAFERNMESGFVAMLTGAGLQNVASSRSSQVFQSPFVSLWFTNGEPILEAQKALPNVPGAYLPWTAYTGTLTTECVTNRTSDLADNLHTTLIARMRKNLQIYRATTRWTQFQNISLIVDIREAGTVDTWEDEENLDHTIITWSVLHCINPAAWPANIYD